MAKAHILVVRGTRVTGLGDTRVTGLGDTRIV